MGDGSGLRSEIRDGVGTLTFDRPKHRNALSPRMLQELHETLRDWADRDAVRVVILRGAGDTAFSSGFDIAAIPTGSGAEGQRRRSETPPLALAWTRVKQFPYPTLAMVNGYCFGAALHLALCCDLRVGADDIAVGMPAARLGIVYPPDGIAQFVAVLGVARAREVFLTGRTYRGTEVGAMRLVDRQVPRAELEPTVRGLAREISANAPLALRGLKRILNRIEAAAPLGQEALREAEALVAEALASDDARRAQRAFLERRGSRTSRT
ncbi:MAG: enoyl-CoA hydratase/isomerase family protein [Myxococcota bacterium]